MNKISVEKSPKGPYTLKKNMKRTFLFGIFAAGFLTFHTPAFAGRYAEAQKIRNMPDELRREVNWVRKKRGRVIDEFFLRELKPSFLNHPKKKELLPLVVLDTSQLPQLPARFADPKKDPELRGHAELEKKSEDLRNDFYTWSNRKIERWKKNAQRIRSLQGGNDGSPQEQADHKELFDKVWPDLSTSWTEWFTSLFWTPQQKKDLLKYYLGLRRTLSEQEYKKELIRLKAEAQALKKYLSPNVLKRFRETGRFPEDFQQRWLAYSADVERFSKLPQTRLEDFKALRAASEPFRKNLEIASYIKAQGIKWGDQTPAYQRALLGIKGKELSDQLERVRQRQFMTAKINRALATGAGTEQDLRELYEGFRKHTNAKSVLIPGQARPHLKDYDQLKEAWKTAKIESQKERARRKGFSYGSPPNPRGNKTQAVKKLSQARKAWRAAWEALFPPEKPDRFYYSIPSEHRARLFNYAMEDEKRRWKRWTPGEERVYYKFLKNMPIGDLAGRARVGLREELIAKWLKKNRPKGMSPEVRENINRIVEKKIYGMKDSMLGSRMLEAKKEAARRVAKRTAATGEFAVDMVSAGAGYYLLHCVAGCKAAGWLAVAGGVLVDAATLPAKVLRGAYKLAGAPVRVILKIKRGRLLLAEKRVFNRLLRRTPHAARVRDVSKEIRARKLGTVFSTPEGEILVDLLATLNKRRANKYLDAILKLNKVSEDKAIAYLKKTQERVYRKLGKNCKIGV